MEFTYNHEGIRTQKVKKVNGEIVETTDYILAGKKIIGMQKGNDRLLFHYDEGGSLIMLRHNGTPYTYVKNIQGDIVGLIDSTGALVVEYKYDAWGNPLSTRTLTTAYDALAELNPFRYRGYVWDTDTERYYVSSRYYKPKFIRWSNADGYVSTGQGVIGCNMYAYCNNNPVIFKDLSGNRAIFTYICLGVMLTGVAIGLGGCSSNDDVEPYSHYANCYAYAMKLERDPRTGAPFSSKPQPGDFSNNRLVREDLIGEPDVVKDNIMSKVHTDSVYLGFTIIEVDSVDYETHDESWLVALVYASDGTDYHWYRRDDDGIWSHKMGVTPVTRWDNSGNAITNPELCDRGIYDIFLGYYEVSLSNGG